jgi:hypothetical protein
MCGRILPIFKFKRNSAKIPSLSDITKLRNNSKIEVSKGNVSLLGRQMNEICLGRAKVYCYS